MNDNNETPSLALVSFRFIFLALCSFPPWSGGGWRGCITPSPSDRRAGAERRVSVSGLPAAEEDQRVASGTSEVQLLLLPSWRCHLLPGCVPQGWD